MKIIIYVVPFLITAFFIIAFCYIRKVKFTNFLTRVEEFNKNIFKKKNKKSKFKEELEFLIQEEGEIKLGFIKLKSIEYIYISRLILASIFFISFNVFGIIFNKNLFIYSVIGSAILYFIPIVLLKRKIEQRKERINIELPDTIDIISSLVKAGLTIDGALNYISKNYNGKIADIFALLQIKILEGYSKKEAYDIISRLSFSSDFKTLIKLLSRSDEIGNPIGDVLKDLSKSIRENQRSGLKIKAERLEGNLILVTFIFIFIPMLLIFLLPVYPQLKILFQ